MSTSGEDHHIVPSFHVRHRRSLIIAVIVALTCLIAWVAGLGPINGVAKYSEKGAIAGQEAGTEFRGDSSALTVRPSTDGKVHVAVLGEYAGAPPMLAVTQEDGHVLIVVNCFAEPGRKCALKVSLTVPPQYPFWGKLSTGNVDIRGLQNRVAFHTESGQITLTDVSGPVETDTLSGPVTGTRLSGSRFTVNSRSGAVNLQCTGTIASLVVNSGTGATTLRVPKVQYWITTDGSEDVKVTVPRLASAYGLIRVTTQDAPIRVSPNP